MPARSPKGKLVFDGEIFRVYQWKQRLYDGSYATFEVATRPSIVQILPEVDQKIAIAFEEQPAMSPTLGLIGGVMEDGEPPLAAAKRELLEESGMNARKWKLLGKFSNSGKVLFDVYLFAAVGCRKVAEQKLDPGEKITVRYTTPGRLMENIARMRTSPEIKHYLTEIRYVEKKRKSFEALFSNGGK